MQPLYAVIGEDFIHKAIREFYTRAFEDSMIGHFFFGKSDSDKEHLISMQIDFALRLLGSSTARYTGRPLQPVHQGLGIRLVHFKRRQVLFAEVLTELGLAEELRDRWLQLENRLVGQIVGDQSRC